MLHKSDFKKTVNGYILVARMDQSKFMILDLVGFKDFIQIKNQLTV